MQEHGALSIITAILPGRKQALTIVLQRIEEGKEDVNGAIPFRKIPGIHFARFVILNGREDAYGKRTPDKLAFTTNFDIPFNDHL